MVTTRDTARCAKVRAAPAPAALGRADETLGLLRGLAELVPGLVFQIRLRRNGRFCFPYASEAMREIFHLDPEEVREDGAKFLARLHPGGRRRFSALYTHLCAGVEPVAARVPRKPG